MARASKPSAAKAAPKSQLDTIVAASNAGGIVYVDATSAEIMELISQGLIETNPTMRDEKGFVAARATPAGLGFAPAPVASVQTSPPSAPAASSGFAIDLSVAPSEQRRAGFARATVYPFDALPAPALNPDGTKTYASFFVPVSADRPEPWRQLASTVSSANGRYAEPTGEHETVIVKTYALDASGKRVKRDGHFVETGSQAVTQPVTRQLRKFIIQQAQPNDPAGAGARIFRVL